MRIHIMTDIVKKFDFGNFNITVVKEGDDIWFKGIDVALAIGYKKPRNAVLRHVDDDDKKVRKELEPAGGATCQNRDYVYINEPGLYSLIFGSELEFAKAFKKWVFSVVLPSIRKTGGYSGPSVLTKGNQLMIMNEKDLHYRVVEYIRKYHPSAIIIAGLGELQDTQGKRISGYKKGYKGGQPDILVLNKTRKHNGLAIELKTPNLTVKLSDKQVEFFGNLSEIGYKTIVSCDYDEVHRLIDEYFRDVRIDCPKCCKKFRSRETLKTHSKWFHQT